MNIKNMYQNRGFSLTKLGKYAITRNPPVSIKLVSVILVGAVAFGGKQLWKRFQRWKLNQTLKKWENSVVRDKVILHSIWRCKTLPSISPFGLKLETYLRMARIPYELDTTDPIGPKGKLPWITFNGTNVADSQLCIEFLKIKFSVNLNKSSTPEQVAIARACRVMLEEHFYWGLVQHRMDEVSSQIPFLTNMPFILKYVMPLVVQQAKRNMDEQGIGQHSSREIYKMTEDDLQTVAVILGDRKFMGGDSPCEEDCSVFGIVAQAVWGMPGSSFERLVHGDLVLLRDYCERMKNLYWQDWNECLDN